VSLQAEIKAQKEELQRQREALQRQVDLFEEQRGQFFRSFASPPGRVMTSGAWPSSDVLAARLAAAMASRSPPDSSGVVTLKNHHHRSASDDLPAGGGRQLSPTGRNAEDFGDAPTIGRSVAESGSSGLPRNGGARVPTVGVTRRDTMPPMHLLSATNEARAGLVQPQRLPLKLASTSESRDSSRSSSNRSSAQYPSPSGSASSQSHFSPTSYDRGSPADYYGQPVGPTSPGKSESAGRLLSSPTSTPPRTESQRLDRDAVVNGVAAAAASTISAGVRFSSPLTNSGAPSHPLTYRPVPPRLVSTLSSGSILPLKLAERQRPKSASPTSSSPVHHHGSPSAPPGGEQTLLFGQRPIATVSSQQQQQQQQQLLQQRTGFVGSSALVTSSPSTSPVQSTVSPECVHSKLGNIASEKEVIYF